MLQPYRFIVHTAEHFQDPIAYGIRSQRCSKNIEHRDYNDHYQSTDNIIYYHLMVRPLRYNPETQ